MPLASENPGEGACITEIQHVLRERKSSELPPKITENQPHLYDSPPLVGQLPLRTTPNLTTEEVSLQDI